MMTPEHADTLGRLVDGFDAVLFSAKLPLPPSVHIEALTAKIREARDICADIVRAETGHDPWATNPLRG
jgi:hypothetical protein